MSSRRFTSWRGAALLFVLALLIVATTAATVIAHAAASLRIQEAMQHEIGECDDLLRSAELAIEHWLQHKSSQIVLPPDNAQPAVTVLDDHIVTIDGEVRITITAFDQYGMAPLSLLRSGSPLRFALPAEILRGVDQIQLADSEPLGLDLFAQSDRESIPIYPTALPGNEDALQFGHEITQSENAYFPQPPGEVVLALGAFVATHGRNSDEASEGAIFNMNTAPIDLLEHTMRLAGRGGIELIIAAREERKPAVVPMSAPSRGQDPSRLPSFTGVSNSWSFRVDVASGHVARSWWLVFERSSTRRQRTWTCVQRILIHE